MSGSGAWDGYGSPPWDPADPVPDAADTQAIPGLGSIRGPADAPKYADDQTWPSPGSRPDHQQDRQRPGRGDPRTGEPRGSFDSARAGNGAAGWNGGPGWNGGTAADGTGGRGRENHDPVDYGSGRYGPGNNGPGTYGPGTYGPGDNGYRGFGPGSYGPGNNGSGSYGPGNSGLGNNGLADGDGSGNASSNNGGRRRSDGNGRATGAHAFSRNADPGPRPRRRRRSFWRELPVLVVVAIVLAVVIKTFAIQAFFIPSGSMQNTLALYDRVLINKVVYHLRPIHRGDIVVFDGSGSWDFGNPRSSPNIFAKVADDLEGVVGITHDSSIYIKRVIGLPGDHVGCCNSKGQVTVNGVGLSESSYLYPGNSPSTQTFHITVPAGRLWVMGDHRAISYDSRGHMGDPGGGTIPESGVLGRAFVIIWPLSQWAFLNIPGTFDQPRLNASSGANAAGANAAAGGSSAALLAALDNGTPVRPDGSPLPLALGFIGAVPLTWLQRAIRLRSRNRRARRAA